MINVYDFDKTIYDGDSTIDFYLYCLNRNKTLIFMLPTQLYGMLLYILKVKEKEYFNWCIISCNRFNVCRLCCISSIINN